MPISLIKFSQTILGLNKEKKYSEALKYFKENKAQFTPIQIAGNDFLISAMLTALRHTSNFDHAFHFLGFYKITISETTNESVLNAFGWLLFSKFRAENLQQDNWQNDAEIFEEDDTPQGGENFHLNKSEMVIRILEFIPLILKFKSEYAYSVFSNLFKSVLKAEKAKINADWNFVNEFCNLVTPEVLSKECTTIEVTRKGVSKPMELASDQENWFAYQSKALMKLGRFQECNELSKVALGTFEKFHYSNDVWFARRIALSKKYSGNSEDAIKELLQVLKRKKEWFIQKELAQLYKETGNTESAFKLSIEAVNNFGELEYKVDLLFLIGELLKEKGQNDWSFKHFSLSRLIRLNEEWRIPSKLQTALSQFENPVLPLEKLPELRNELKRYWDSFNPQPNQPKKVSTNQYASGKIDKILHNDEKGADGFIRYGDRKSIYFRVNATEEIAKKLTLGLTVEFKIVAAAGDKKDKAIQLKVK